MVTMTRVLMSDMATNMVLTEGLAHILKVRFSVQCTCIYEANSLVKCLSKAEKVKKILNISEN